MLVADPLDVVLAEPVGQHRRALQRLDSHDPAPVVVLQAVAGGDRPSRPRRRDEGGEAQAGTVGGDRVEDVAERPPGDLVVGEVVAELTELVEDDIARILGQLVAGVVDLLDVGLGPERADDVVGRVLAPPLQPVETLLAHPFRKDGDPAAGHDPADGDAATGVVAGRRPDRPLSGRVELTGDDARCQAGVGGEHLVGRDHREAITEHHDDRTVDACELGRQHDVLGDADTLAGQIVVPMVAPQVASIGTLRIGVADTVGVDVSGRRARQTSAA